MHGNFRLLNAEQVLTLLLVYVELKKFVAVFIKSNYVDATILIHLRLQLIVLDKVYDHFEVENS